MLLLGVLLLLLAKHYYTKRSLNHLVDYSDLAVASDFLELLYFLESLEMSGLVPLRLYYRESIPVMALELSLNTPLIDCSSLLLEQILSISLTLKL